MISIDFPESRDGGSGGPLKGEVNSPAVNLFPPPLRQAVTEHYATDSLGAVLLRQGAERASGGGTSHTASLDQDLVRLLHPREKTRASSYRLAKRRDEFVLGRASAKLALAEYWRALGFHPDPQEVEIVNDDDGRPVTVTMPSGDIALPPAEISITHGGGFAAALAGALPCGVDLQEQKETLVRVREKYCLGDEERLLAASLPGLAPLARLSLLWTAKEAVKKACSCRWMPGFLDLRLERPVCPQSGCHVLTLTVSGAPAGCMLPARLTVLATTCHGCGLALCILKEARHAGTAGS